MADNGDPWTVWLAEHGPALVLLARQWVDCRADAEDVVQEAFVRFWRSRERIAEPIPYLFACVKHCAWDWQRGARRRLRREEAVGLRWAEVDEVGSCLRLEATKTGRSTRPVGKAALDIIRTLPRQHPEWVFPNRDASASADLKKPIADLFDAAGLKDARSQDLRRTFASMAAEEGYSDATIGELLGHARRGVTARHYIRRPDAALIAAADVVSAKITTMIDGAPVVADVVPLTGGRKLGQRDTSGP